MREEAGRGFGFYPVIEVQQPRNKEHRASPRSGAEITGALTWYRDAGYAEAHMTLTGKAV